MLKTDKSPTNFIDPTKPAQMGLASLADPSRVVPRLIRSATPMNPPAPAGSPPVSSAEAFAALRVEVNTADRAYRQLKSQISFEVEELWALALDPRKTLLRSQMIFRGTVDACLVHPRDIFRFAYQSNASSFLVAHSHPSGDLLPSEHDIVFTQELLRAGKFLQLPLMDHLILTRSGYSSFANEGWCRFSKLAR